MAAVLEREVTEWDEFTGRLEAVESVAIRPRVTGYVESVDFAEGSIVHKAAALTNQLAPLSAHGLQVEYVVFPQETHNSVIPAYLGRGARFTLSGWYE